jgi:hypothetical protein
VLYIIEHEQLFYTFAKGAESVNPESISGIQNQEIKEIFKNGLSGIKTKTRREQKQ